MKSFQEFLNEDVLEEKSRRIGNFLSHMADDRFVIIMSVEKGPAFYTNETDLVGDDLAKYMRVSNIARTNSFRTELKGIKCGYVGVVGSYKEAIPMGNGTSKLDEVEEHSTICYGNSENKDKLIDICLQSAKEYQQDSILVATKGKAALFYTNKCINNKGQQRNPGDVDIVRSFHPKQVGTYYTELRNHKDNSVRFSFNDEKMTNRNVMRYFDHIHNGKLKEDRF